MVLIRCGEMSSNAGRAVAFLGQFSNSISYVETL